MIKRGSLKVLHTKKSHSKRLGKQGLRKLRTKSKKSSKKRSNVKVISSYKSITICVNGNCKNRLCLNNKCIDKRYKKQSKKLSMKKRRSSKKISRTLRRKFGELSNECVMSIKDNGLYEYYFCYYNNIKKTLINYDFFNLNDKSDKSIINLPSNFFLKDIPININPLNKNKAEISDYIYKKYENSDDKKTYEIIGMGIKYLNPNGGYMSKGSFDKQPIVNLYRCHNSKDPIIEIYRFGTKISLEDRNTDFISKLNDTEGIKLIKNIPISKSKKILCISLVSPCNESICYGTKRNIVESVSSAAKKGFSESTVLGYELNNIDKDITFISFPLSNNSFKGMVPLYNYENLKNDILTGEGHNSLKSIIYNRINLQTPKSTFESIVYIAYYYYYNLKSDYVLMFHCKSGRDRSGIFDSVLQASIYHIQNTGNKEPTNKDFNLIRIYSQRFLFHGLSIAYYATSIISLKLNSISAAKFILGTGDLYKFYSGHSKYAGSSA